MSLMMNSSSFRVPEPGRKIIGNCNNILCNSCHIIGNCNKITGTNNQIIGNNNNVYGMNNNCTGFGNNCITPPNPNRVPVNNQNVVPQYFSNNQNTTATVRQTIQMNTPTGPISISYQTGPTFLPQTSITLTQTTSSPARRPPNPTSNINVQTSASSTNGMPLQQVQRVIQFSNNMSSNLGNNAANFVPQNMNFNFSNMGMNSNLPTGNSQALFQRHILQQQYDEDSEEEEEIDYEDEEEDDYDEEGDEAFEGGQPQPQQQQQQQQQQQTFDIEEEQEKTEENQLIEKILSEMSPNSIPNGFICPITQEIMHCPALLAESGFTYEKKAIRTWLLHKNTDPQTNLPLNSFLLIPNRNLKKAIDDWKQECLKKAQK